MTINAKEKKYNALVTSVGKCDICPRMCARKKVLSDSNGNINSKVVFIAEAPGRLGAECTGIPLYGDVTGSNFETLLSNIGWSRQDVFITNAILCNPQDENGNNATPTKEEVKNCSYYLSMVLELIHPEVVVTLGVKALEALKNIEHHEYSLKENVAQLLPWHETYVFPLYHMSPRATIHRSLLHQRMDFIALAHEVSPKTGLKKNKITNQVQRADVAGHDKLKALSEYIVRYLGEVSFFKLTKLLFLIDYNYLVKNQKTITNGIYLRMQEGPWIPYLKNVIHDNKNIQTVMQGNKPVLRYTVRKENVDLSENESHFAAELLEKYRGFSDGEIKSTVYLTKPMKYILREEKKGRTMTKVPVLYQNKMAGDQVEHGL